MRTIAYPPPPFASSQQDPFINFHMAVAAVGQNMQHNPDDIHPQHIHSPQILHNTDKSPAQRLNNLPPPSPLNSAASPRPLSANGMAHPTPATSTSTTTEAATPTPAAQMSIASLLAQSQPATQESQQSVWNVHDLVVGAPPVQNGQQQQQQPSSSKRRLEDSDSDAETQAKLRRTTSAGGDRNMTMTTVVCLHAAVAQKSYGSEKRFLCPPPLVRIEGPFGQIRDQQLSMAIVSENGERAPEQKAPLDGTLMASFKFLHVSGTAKAKSFQLALNIAQPDGPVSEGPARTWATFESAPVTIISKPSKKTAKTRNIQSCILAGGPVSLFNRINSQTVRTKYMTIDHAHLCASNVSWSAFNVNVIHRPGDGVNVATPGPHPVTYGSEIVLSDSMTGIATASLIIRKVDKGKISVEDGGPVSQMQKIALQRVNPDGTRHYLSAAGPLPGTQGVVAPPAPGMASQSGTHHLIFQSPRIREDVTKTGERIMIDEVDDYLCWTIVGISKFQYTFFDALGQNNKIPDMPITPFPTLFTPPSYRPQANTVEMTVSNFFYENPKTGHSSALEVWLGDIGPLQQRVYPVQAAGPLTNISPFQGHGVVPGADGSVMTPMTPPPTGNPAQHSMPNTPSGEAGSSSAVPQMQSPPVQQFQQQRYSPMGPTHTNVMVEMPPVMEIMKVLQAEAKRMGGPPPPPPNTAVDLPNGASGGDGENSSHSNAPGGGAGGDVSEDVASIAMAIAGRSLPLLFIRGADGIGYHSGRTIAVENMFHGLDAQQQLGPPPPGNGQDNNTWLLAAQAAATAAIAADGGMSGWTLRVL